MVANKYSSSNFTTKKPFAKLDYYFLKSFSFVTEYEFYHYYNKAKTGENGYDFLSSILIYQKKDGQWEYKVAATYMQNTQILNDDNFCQFSTRTS